MPAMTPRTTHKTTWNMSIKDLKENYCVYDSEELFFRDDWHQVYYKFPEIEHIN